MPASPRRDRPGDPCPAGQTTRRGPCTAAALVQPRQDPELLPEEKAIRDEPRFGDPAILEAVDADLAERDLASGRFDRASGGKLPAPRTAT